MRISQRSHGSGRAVHPRIRIVLACLYVLAALAAGAGPHAGAAARPDLHVIRIPGPAKVEPSELRDLVAGIRAAHPSGPRDIVVALHGYDVRPAVAREQYELLARRLRAAEGAGSRAAVVGVAWESDPGPARTWLARAAGQRVMKAIGLGKRARDPYSTISWRAGRTGRQGLRQVLFALKEAFPGARLHVAAHSLGAKVAMHALAPDLADDEQMLEPPFAPGRELSVSTMLLAGADLDENLFATGHQADAARAALPRADLWWFTVAPPGRKDKVLRVRKAHWGRPAIGNTGPRFAREDAERLLREGRLIVDMEGIPPRHAFVKYFSEERLERLAAAAGQLAARAEGPDAAVAGLRQTLPGDGKGGPASDGRDLLARIDAVLAAPANPAALRPFLSDPAASVRLYAAWRLDRLRESGDRHFNGEFTVPRALAAIAAGRNGQGEE